MDRLIFLDFDGVLNSASNYRRLRLAGQPAADEYGTLFDERCVAELGRILDHYGDVALVVTSSWRYVHSADTLRTMWRKRRLPGCILGILPTDIVHAPNETEERGIEVQEWLRRQGLREKDCKYVILDDEDAFTPPQHERLVLTDPDRGLTPARAAKALRLLQ